MIKKGYQRFFVLKFISIVAVGMGMVILSLYFDLSVNDGSSYSESIRSFIVGHAAISSATTKVLIGESLIAPIIVIFIAIYASHKIAGPVYHFMRVLNGLSKQSNVKQVMLRKGDQFEATAEKFNDMLKAINDNYGDIIGAYERADQTRSRLQDSEQAMEEMREDLDKLDRAIGKFNV